MSHKWMYFNWNRQSGKSACGTGQCVNTVRLADVCLQKNQLGNIMFLYIGTLVSPLSPFFGYETASDIAKKGYSVAGPYSLNHPHSNNYKPFWGVGRADNLAAFGVGEELARNQGNLTNSAALAASLASAMNDANVLNRFASMHPNSPTITPDTLTFAPNNDKGFNTRSCRPCTTPSVPGSGVPANLMHDPNGQLSIDYFNKYIFPNYELAKGVAYDQSHWLGFGPSYYFPTLDMHLRRHYEDYTIPHPNYQGLFDLYD